MKDRYVIIKHNAKAYQKASKKAKSQILDELTGILHMKAVSCKSSEECRGGYFEEGGLVVVGDVRLRKLSKRGRKRVYGEEVVRVIKKVWHISGFISSKHLVGFIRLNHEIIFRHKDFRSLLTDKAKGHLAKGSLSIP
jgi:hypothetical protein